MKKYQVEYLGGESRYSNEACDYMLTYVPDENKKELIELYAECESCNDTPENNEREKNVNDETSTYDILKEMILDQAREKGVDPDCLVFWLSDEDFSKAENPCYVKQKYMKQYYSLC